MDEPFLDESPKNRRERQTSTISAVLVFFSVVVSLTAWRLPAEVRALVWGPAVTFALAGTFLGVTTNTPRANLAAITGILNLVALACIWGWQFLQGFSALP